MLPKSHPLIEAIVKPLSDNAEQKLAATAMLEETFDTEHPAIPETLDRLDKVGIHKVPALPTILLGISAAISLIIITYTQLPDIRVAQEFSRMSLLTLPEWPPNPPGLTPQQQLLFGDPELPILRQKELLFQSDPGNPAYYAEYLGAYSGSHKILPPDYFETIARIAPKNSFFLYYDAGQIGGKSVEKKNSTKGYLSPRIADGVRLSPLPVEKEFIVTDQAAFDEAVLLIEKATKLPEFETYGNRMIATRIPFLPSTTLAENATFNVYRYGLSSGVISLRLVTDVLNTQAQLLSKAGKVGKFVSLAQQQRHFVESFANNPDGMLVNELVYLVTAASTTQNFYWSADRLGLAQLTKDYKRQMDAIQEDRDRRDTQWKTEDTSDIVRKRGSFLAGLTLPMVKRQVAEPPPLTDADLKPLRLVDHDIALRVGITAAALIIAILCLPVYFFRYHSPRALRIPAMRLSKILRPVDWIWIITLGVVAPIILFLAINRLTPLGGRDYAIRHFFFLFPGVQLVAILLNLLLAPAVLIRWRLSKRLAPFGIESRSCIVSFAVLCLILVWSLCAYPIMMLNIGNTIPVLISMAGIPALWLVTISRNILLTVIGKSTGRILRIATTSALLPAYASAIIALCLTVPLFVASEKHWMKQDTLFRVNPDAPDLGAYEYKVAAQKRKEINAILGL